MLLDRRRLLSRFGSGFTAALLLPSFRADAGRVLLSAAKSAEGRKPADLAGDEAYWSESARAFDSDRTRINLNYGRMITTWEQRARREGIVLKQISFPVPPPSREDVVDRFRRAITPRTRVLEVTHITNLTGQILPVKEIVRMAREKNVEVFVDG